MSDSEPELFVPGIDHHYGFRRQSKSKLLQLLGHLLDFLRKSGTWIYNDLLHELPDYGDRGYGELHR